MPQSGTMTTEQKLRELACALITMFVRYNVA